MAVSPLIRWARGGALVFEFTGTILASSICGWAVDNWFETGPWGFLALSLLGTTAAFIRLVQLVRRFDRMDRGER